MATSRSLRISAVLGAATVAGIGLGAGSAEACQTTPPPNHPCAGGGTIPAADLQYREAGTAMWTDVGQFHVLKDEPVHGIEVRINPRSWYATADCTRDVSLASYQTHGPTWATSGEQVFVGYATTQLSGHHPSATLLAPLPGGAATPTCWGQLDLYLGRTIFDGTSAPGHGPLPRYPNAIFPTNLITAWNGGTTSCDATPTPTTPPTTEPPTTEPPTTEPPTTQPPTSTSIKPSTPTPAPPTSSTPPATPATPTPTPTTPKAGTTPPPATATPTPPTLAVTGSNTAPLALGAFGLLGVGSAVMVAARRTGRQH